MKRDNIETFRLPFLIDEVLDELRMLIWCTASQVALLGRSDLGDAMIEKDADFGMSETPSRYLPRINLDAFDIAKTVRDAYDFAFQVNDPSRFTGDDWGDLMSLVYGCARHSWSGDISPPCREESRLRHVADMVQGRVQLLTDGALSIRQLALLANMIEPAVRSSLSAEGIKTEGRPASLPAAKALKWLRGRRGFVPTSDGQVVHDLSTAGAILEVRPFPAALEFMCQSSDKSRDEILSLSQIGVEQFDALLAGKVTEIGVPALVRLAKALLSEPEAFVASYVKFLSAA